jgi:RimJ/RimL family protein N-acetyltransferase
LDNNNCNAEFSIFLSNTRLMGKGLGTDALNAVLDFGFMNLPLERVCLMVRTENRRAIRSYEKAGMVPEGTLRKARRYQGRLVDKLLMSMLREEWKAQERTKVMTS